MWLAQVKLTRNGNATAVTIPRTFLHQLGWLSGRSVVMELDDKLECIVVRLPQAEDFGPIGQPFVRRVPETPQP